MGAACYRGQADTMSEALTDAAADEIIQQIKDSFDKKHEIPTTSRRSGDWVIVKSCRNQDSREEDDMTEWLFYLPGWKPGSKPWDAVSLRKEWTDNDSKGVRPTGTGLDFSEDGKSVKEVDRGFGAVMATFNLDDLKKRVALLLRNHWPVTAVAVTSDALIVAGTRDGQLILAGPGDELRTLEEGHNPAAVTTLLLSPATDGLGGVLLEEGARGPRGLFSADSAGRLRRTWLPEEGGTSHALASTLCAELASAILALELCPKTGSRLLVSTSERIAVIADALGAEVAPAQWVGSKPHKSHLTATFCDHFGPEADLIAARPGGRLWVASADSGTVRTTLIFQNPGGEGKAALGSLLPLRRDRVLSVSRSDAAEVILLDLEAIAISSQWSTPPVVDAVPWPGGALLAHSQGGASVVLLSAGPLVICRATIAAHGADLLGSLGKVNNLRASLEAVPAGEVLEGLAPVVAAVAADVSEGGEEAERHKAAFTQWVSDLEDRQLEAEREASRAAGKPWAGVRLVDASLSNFPVAAWDVLEEECGGDEAHQRGQDIEGLLSPSLWLQSLELIACHAKETGVAPCLGAFEPAFLRPMVQALETPGHLAVCQHGAPLLPWLAERLEAEATDLGSSAALALELLVAGEDWPSIGLSPSAGGEPEVWERERLAAHLRNAVPGSALPASAALALCRFCLAKDDLLAAERCHFWANGLVTSSSPGWREVAAFARNLGPAAPVQPASAATWREAVLAALAADRCWPLQALLAQGLASDGGQVAAPGDVFEAALTAFPKVLPWNIVDWMSWAFEHPGRKPKVLGLSLPIEKRSSTGPRLMGFDSVERGILSCSKTRPLLLVGEDALVQELLQYVMKLLPTCERNTGFAELLKAALALALHRRPAEWLQPPPLRAGRCLLADALIRRFSAKHLELCQRLCDDLRYPLGLMQLLLGGEEPCCDDSSDTLGQISALLARSRAMQDQTVEVSESRFREVASAVLRSAAVRTAEEASEPPGPAAPVKAPTPRCAICDTPGCEVAIVRGASRPVVRKDGRINAWHDVALALHRLSQPRLSGPDEHRWQFVMEAASKAPPGLLAALAALVPGRSATEACLRSIEDENFSGSGLLSDGTSAAAAAEAQWQTAFAGNWLQLPPEQKSPLPPRPRPQPPPRKQPDVPEGLRKAGSGVQLWISEDGLQARHLDDTGEEMHGVLIGTRPLALGRAGAYFEVALEEVRPGESPDGLTVGVTTTPPDDVAAVPQTAEHIADTWSVGYDGQMWDCKSASLKQVGWDPRSLAEGDIIGVLITAREGELIVFRNGTAVCAGPRSIPVDAELYAVVDLLGAARAVRWVRDAQAPGQ
ncbi:unnamed protein product [Symbiodinium sp. CCMP2592]|nr:unnamed protein product [Symbiodinium sp. CCMP2592]